LEKKLKVEEKRMLLTKVISGKEDYLNKFNRTKEFRDEMLKHFENNWDYRKILRAVEVDHN
jgi:hypothetical protein